MDIFILVGALALLLFALWKWATPKTQSLPSIKPTAQTAPEVSIEVLPVVTEMAVTDGAEEPPAKKVRKPRKKTVAKKAVKKPRKPKAS
jgi:hypothetical protein